MSNGHSSPPPGYELIFGSASGFNQLTGPFYMRIENELAIVAFRIEPKHLNPAGGCHGAALAALADNLGAPLKRMMDLDDVNITPTINLAIDYMAPAKAGDWVELHARLLRRTRTLFFLPGTNVRRWKHDRPHQRHLHDHVQTHRRFRYRWAEQR